MSDLSSRIAGLSPRKRELLLRQLAKKQGGEAPPAAARIERRPRTGGEERFPVSFSQLREWILDRIEPGNPAYNVPGASRASGPLSVAALRGAVQEIVRRHESLRTTFSSAPEGGAEPLQVVAPSLAIPVPLIDLSALSPEVREAEGHRLAKGAIREPFDLARGPLLRVRLIRLSEREHLIPFILHHIVSDGWSMGVFSRELSVLYAAIEAGRPSPLPELPIQYGDFAAWQRDWLQGETLERHLDYWRRQLAGAPPLLTLPTDRPRPPVQTFRGGKLAWRLAREESAGLRALAQESGTSLFVTLLASFQAVLCRWSGQEDVCVGTFSGNRTRSEVEGLIGFFINTLVLRGDLTGDPTFREQVKRLRETALEAYSHGEIPFEKLLDALRLERDLSHTPLFQAMLVLQNFPMAEMQPSEVVLSPLPLQDDRADFDLSLWLFESDGQVGGYFEYNTDLFDEATIGRLGEHLRNLAGQAVARPDLRLSDLELWGSEERARVLASWSRVEEAGPVPLVHRAFEARAERAPDALALVSDEGALTYRELNERAEALAAHLRRLFQEPGAGPERIVGVCLDRSFELIVSLLAVVKSGAAYLPLDPDYPADRLAYMLEDSGAAALIARRDLPTDLPRISPDAAGSAPAANADPDPDHPVYVIYTSGSTGRPKGVLVRHGSLAQYAETARRAYGIGAGDRVLQFASISFDTSAEEIYPCLTGGGTLVLRGQSKPQDAGEFLASAGRLGITVLDLPTAYWHELVSALERDPDLAVPPSVRLVILGGERALPSRVRSWRERLRGQVPERVRLVNTYGPTESTIVATHADLAPGPWPPHWDAEVPIGQPIRGARAYVLDRRLRPVPQGVYGELCVGGTGVARGYLGRPELTAERFVPDAFSREPGARLYRTGDLARFRPDGRLEFGGRVDQQVKIRGVRVEPGEVETALVTHPAVAEAAAAARPDVVDGHRLIAWVVPRPGVSRPEEPTVGELREFLRDRLPEAMVPSAFVTVPALPRLPNGKVDRRALPDPSGERANLGTAYAAPETELERTIAGVWQDLLRVATVGLHDNFFDLGGHSLLLVQAQGRLREALGRDIPVVDLFRFPTVSLLARHLGEGEEDAGAASAAAAKKVQDLGGKQRSAMDRQRQAMAKAMQSRLKKP